MSKKPREKLLLRRDFTIFRMIGILVHSIVHPWKLPIFWVHSNEKALPPQFVRAYKRSLSFPTGQSNFRLPSQHTSSPSPTSSRSCHREGAAPSVVRPTNLDEVCLGFGVGGWMQVFEWVLAWKDKRIGTKWAVIETAFWKQENYHDHFFGSFSLNVLFIKWFQSPQHYHYPLQLKSRWKALSQRQVRLK